MTPISAVRWAVAAAALSLAAACDAPTPVDPPRSGAENDVSIDTLAIDTLTIDTTVNTPPDTIPFGDVPNDTVPGDDYGEPVDLTIIEHPTEEEFALIAAEVPGFGGYYYDETGDRVVYLTDLSQADAALASIDAHAEPVEPGEHPEEYRSGITRYVQGDYGYGELDAWRQQAIEGMLTAGGVVFLDLDETVNRLVVGVSDPGAEYEVRAQLDAAGVPQEVVVFELTEPVYELATLRDRIRPLQGGLSIVSARGTCTLGFIVEWSYHRGFVTNSHCTALMFALDRIRFYQNRWVAGDYVGYEVADPAALRCFRRFPCRYSDAALVRTLSDVPTALGRIARTTWARRGPGAVGSITIDPVTPQIRIVAKRGATRVGDEVSKMGQTTGWTYGPVTRTCADTWNNTGQLLLCQDHAGVGSAGGDSGSPVFLFHSGSRATLQGILWGGNGRSMVFSPLRLVERELGALTVF